jgi:hypothetical protein
MFRPKLESPRDATDRKYDDKQSAVSTQAIHLLKNEIGKIEQEITQEFEKIKRLYALQSHVYPDPTYELMKKSKQNFESELDEKSLEKMNRKYFEREMDLALFEWAKTPAVEKRTRLILENVDQLNHLRRNKRKELEDMLKFSIHKIDLKFKLIEWNASADKNRCINVEKKNIQENLAIIVKALAAVYVDNGWGEMPTHENDLILKAKKYRDRDPRLLPALKKIYSSYDILAALNTQPMTVEQQTLIGQRTKLLYQLRKLGSGVSAGNPEEVVDLYKRHKF